MFDLASPLGAEEVLQAEQKRIETEQAAIEKLAAARYEVAELDQALDDALLLIDTRLAPYLSGSPTERRLINLAIYVELLVSGTDTVRAKATPLYARLVPLARQLAPDTSQAGPAQIQRQRPKNGRSPAIRGYGSKYMQMAERAGFEPAMEFNPHTRLAGECLQPLGHLSQCLGRWPV